MICVNYNNYPYTLDTDSVSIRLLYKVPTKLSLLPRLQSNLLIKRKRDLKNTKLSRELIGSMYPTKFTLENLQY